MRIQHNIAAMSAYRNYTNNVSAVNKNLEKLSSGYKINRAGDDAAGLAISEKMRAQISGLEAAQKNAKDGISLVKTAEGALTEVHDMLNRMVTLATQSANGTYDNTTDRAQLQKEMDQLKSEINRIADSSNFNGIQLLDGSMEVKTEYSLSNVMDPTQMQIVAEGQLGNDAQVGIFQYDLSQWSVTTTDETDPADRLKDLMIGTKSVADAFDPDPDVGGLELDAETEYSGEAIAKQIAKFYDGSDAAHTFTITNNGETVNFDVSAKDGILTLTMTSIPTEDWDTAMNLKLENGVTDNQGQQIKPTVIQEPVSSAKGRLYAQATLDLSAMNIKDGTALKIGDTTYTFAVGADSSYKNATNVIDLTDSSATADDFLQKAANRLSAAAQNNSKFIVGSITDQNGTAFVSLTEKEGAIDYSVNNLAGADGIGGYSPTGGGPNYSDNNELDGSTLPDPDVTLANWKGLVQLGTSKVSGTGLTLQIGDTSADYNQLNVSINDCHTKSLGLDNISIATQAGAQSAVDAIKNAINYVSDVRGTLGATQNRLEHTINNLSVMTANIQDAESTIRDTDIAEEMMAYTKNNILVQSAQAMLAQANQIPQGVLQLLG